MSVRREFTPRKRPLVRLMLANLVFLGGLSAIAVFAGAADLEISTVWRAIVSPDAPDLDPVDVSIIWRLRLPRIVLAALVGASLALSGTLLQGLFRNGLASPDIIGTSSGAALGAILALSTGLALRSLFYVPLCAVAGAFMAIFVVMRIARGGSTATFLLAGIALTAFIGSLNSWIIAQSWEEWEVARRVAYWLMGSVRDRSWEHVLLVLPGFVFGALTTLYRARDLDLLLEGSESARALGVEVESARRQLLVAAALMTGSAVAVSGIIGFVGLVVPHLVRLVVGPSHRILLVGSLLTGAWFLVAADLVARLAVRPAELHLGVVTAFVGAPFFCFLLVRHRGVEGP